MSNVKACGILVPHKLVLRARDPQKAMTGNNCELLLDDKPLMGVKKLTFAVEARGLATLTLEMLAVVDIEGLVEVKEEEKADPEQEG